MAGLWTRDATPEMVETALRSGRATMGITKAFTGAQATDNERKWIARLVPQLWQDPNAARMLAFSLTLFQQVAAYRYEKNVKIGSDKDINLVPYMDDLYKKWQQLSEKYAAEWKAKKAAGQDPGAFKPPDPPTLDRIIAVLKEG
jgi:hypothetical protein